MALKNFPYIVFLWHLIKRWQTKFCICWCVRLCHLELNFLLPSSESPQIRPKWPSLWCWQPLYGNKKLLWISLLSNKIDMNGKFLHQLSDWRKLLRDLVLCFLRQPSQTHREGWSFRLTAFWKVLLFAIVNYNIATVIIYY